MQLQVIDFHARFMQDYMPVSYTHLSNDVASATEFSIKIWYLKYKEK